MVLTEARPARREIVGAGDQREIALRCPNCGAEIRIRRGDPAKTKKTYTCTCGTELEIPTPEEESLTLRRIS